MSTVVTTLFWRDWASCHNIYWIQSTNTADYHVVVVRDAIDMTDSLCGSVLEHRSRETEFLTNVQNFFYVPCSWRDEKSYFAIMKSHRYQNNYKWNVITRPFQTRESEIHARNARETTPISYFQDIDFTFLTWWNATNNGCCLDSFNTLKKN